MSSDKSYRSGHQVLNTLREMLGLEGDAFISAMREAVWVPGGVDQLADLIVRSLSPDDQYRLTEELPDVPEVMALTGRLLLALNTHPGRQALGQEILQRARKVGPEALRYLSPYTWYPPVDQIRTVLVSPYRLHAPSLMLRMQWGGEFEGVEAVWMIRFGAGDLGEVYFVTDDTEKAPFEEMQWIELTMEKALSLITSAGLVSSAVSNHFPFDGMTGVGLWMVLAGGREVAPWIDSAYALEMEPLSAKQAALAELNALNVGDFLAAYDLLDPENRLQDVLKYIEETAAERSQQGELWRLDSGPVTETGDTATLVLRGWYRQGSHMVDRAWETDLRRDGEGHWRVRRMDVVSEETVNEDHVDQYLRNHPRYFAQLAIEDMENLAELMPGPPDGQTDRAVHFSSGPDFDYRNPYDIAQSQDVNFTIVLDDEAFAIVWASNEILLHREISRLQEQGAAAEVILSGVTDLVTAERIQDATDEGSQAVNRLLRAMVD